MQPGYYKANSRQLTVRELLRMGGLLRFPYNYLFLRHKPPVPAGWMPNSWDELECEEHELSADFIQATSRCREYFRELGFTEVGFKRSQRSLHPRYRDNGGINLLDRTGCHYGQMIYVRFHRPPPAERDLERIAVSFTAVFEEGTFSYSNNTSAAFDSMPGDHVVRVGLEDVHHLYQLFLRDLERRKDSPRRFADRQSLREWFDAHAREVFEHQVLRGLFLPMTDAEVDAARRAQQGTR